MSSAKSKRENSGEEEDNVDIETRRKKHQMSLDELAQEVLQLETFMTMSEELVEKEKQRDEELYEREKRRKLEEREQSARRRAQRALDRTKSGKKAKVTYKVGKPPSPKTPRQSPSKELVKLYFRNGQVRCMDCDNLKLSLKQTKETVKMILQRQADNPLVSEERVRTALENIRREMGLNRDDSFDSNDMDDAEVFDHEAPTATQSASTEAGRIKRPRNSSVEEYSPVGSSIEEYKLSLEDTGDGATNNEAITSPTSPTGSQT